MRKLFFITLLFFHMLHIAAQENTDFAVELGKTKLLTEKQNQKVNTAIAAWKTVQKTGNYIKSLTELLSKKQIPLPVGIKGEEGGYELIIHEISQAGKNTKSILRATCAFRFKDTGQTVAFEGEAEVKGKNGMGTSGRLTLIAPVERKIGSHSTLVVREGTSVSFGCGGIESFDARMAWIVTSDRIFPTDAHGNRIEGQPLGVAFNVWFENFDNYVVPVSIERSFGVKGLNGMTFTLRGAVIDQSDTQNSGMTRFPSGYFGTSGAETVNLWKGVSISEAAVSLPSYFKQPGSGERITLSLSNALFDENGFTGSVSAQNLIPGSTIDPKSWDASLNGFNLGILKNSIDAFGISGQINIPPFGKNSLLPYSATFNPLRDEYEFRVSVAGEYDFPALRSKLTLTELSTIQLQFKDNKLYPSINASGKLTINAPVSSSDSTKVFSVPDINFENLILSREAPYVQIGHIGVTGNIQPPSIAGFEMSINDIESFKSPEGDGLRFTAGIGLSNGGLPLSGQAGIKLFGDYANWKFNKVAIDKINVDFRSSAFSIKGGVWFKNGDAVYGNGFRGDLKFELLNKFTFDAVGIFGRKDDYRYFLTDVFFETSPAQGLFIPPVLSFYGFGGGLYHRMQQAGKSASSLTSSISTEKLDFGRSLSGINYLPDKNVGLGLMASAKFALMGSEKAFNAKVGFEMQFNSRGGLNFVQLRGDGAFMDAPDKWGGLSDNVSGYTADKQSKGETVPQKKTKAEADKQPSNKNSSLLSASMLFEYDNMNDRFNADLSTYLNAYGVIKGIGPNDRFGWANAYIAPGKWHFYLGTPSDRMGVSVLNLAQLNGYVMLGDDIPALPLPPERVLQYLSESKRKQLNKRSEQKFGEGKGIAFGAAFETGFDASFLIFYASLHVGLGAEFMLTNVGGQTCEGIDGKPGLNGWYAQGQAWAYVDANIGLQAKVFGKRRRFSILDIGVGALLEAKGPKPFYFAGAVGGRYRVLGGLIKGNCNFEFELGEECKLVGGSPFGEDVIAQLTPGTGSSDVSVFASPQAVFNIPVDKEMTINEDDGRKGTYKALLEEFTVRYKGGAAVKKADRINEDGTVSIAIPDEPFESQKEVELYAKVSFQQKQGNRWVTVKEGNGQPVYEEKRASFTTGDRPKEIQPEHVAYSYPASRQYNFHPGEYDRGYILLTQNYSYLFTSEKPEGFSQKLKISSTGGDTYTGDFSHTTQSNISGVRMEIGFPLNNAGLEKDKIYRLAIVNTPLKADADLTGNITETTTQMEGMEQGSAEVTRRKAEGSVANLIEKEIYSLSFKTSHYNTFAEKIKRFDRKENGWRDPVEPYIHHIGLNMPEGEELFDKHETGDTPGQGVIRFEAKLNDTEWYNRSFYKWMYETLPMPGIQQYHATLGAPVNCGAPPVQAVSITTETPGKMLSDDEINVGTASGFGARGAFRYAIPYWAARDMFYMKEQVARKILREQPVSQDEIAMLNMNTPPVVRKGNYPVTVNYVLPGKGVITSSEQITVYNPVD